MAQRRKNMQAIRNKDTRPEILVRSIVHRLGYRYKLHRKDLPGHPDMVFTRHRKIVFVHGCFWHMHKCRYGRVKPATNVSFWKAKREANVARDKKNLRKLRKDGWQVLVVWECWTRNPSALKDRLVQFLK